MNKKGNAILFVILTFIFIIFWIFFLASFLNLAGQMYIDANNPGGLERWFYSNLNLIVFMALVISVLIYGGLNSQ